jgi:hypothetical protein
MIRRNHKRFLHGGVGRFTFKQHPTEQLFWVEQQLDLDSISARLVFF